MLGRGVHPPGQRERARAGRTARRVVARRPLRSSRPSPSGAATPPTPVPCVDEPARVGRSAAARDATSTAAAAERSGAKTTSSPARTRPTSAPVRCSTAPAAASSSSTSGTRSSTPATSSASPPKRVLAPVDLRDRDPLVRGGERRAGILARPPQGARGRGAQLDGLLEADVERDCERLHDAGHDPLERDRVVETGHQQRELVTADRRREARRHDERQPVGCVAQHPVADLVTVPVVDHPSCRRDRRRRPRTGSARR